MPILKTKRVILDKSKDKTFKLNNPFGAGKIVYTKESKPLISIDSLPLELDLVIVRAGGYWYVDIIDNILKTKITSNKDGVNTFTEAFQDAVDKIPKH